MLGLEWAVVVEVSGARPGLDELAVEREGRRERAIGYHQFTGPLRPGDRVLLNTAAMRLGLGTGGYHFVVARMPRESEEQTEPFAPPGHIIKLRYTPLQFPCLTVEAPESPHHAAMAASDSIVGMPVLAASLHSQIAPAAVGIRLERRKARIAYIMTDTAALPIAFSRLATELRERGLIDLTITVGQAFGGDLEAVNLYSGLLAARAVGEADVAIVCQGPGNVGTGTDFGFSGIGQADALNAAAALGGRPVAALRISFADPRPRHQGVSRHSLMVLGRAVLAADLIVAIPQLEESKARLIRRQLEEAHIHEIHRIWEDDGEPVLREMARLGLEVKTMGRGVAEDREFFLAAGAAGVAAGSI